MLKKIMCWTAVAVAACLPLNAEAAKRALVVGVNVYDNLGADSQLEKAVNDARAMARAFKSLGFEVEIIENADRRSFNRTWSKFLERLEPRDVAAFQYSGHGVEIDGANYLVLRDAPKPELGAKTMMMSESIAVDRLLREMQERRPQVSLLILDACRNNPFDVSGKRAFGGAGGLARVDPPEGAFVMLSAGARQSALDRLSGADPDQNSIYTRKLLPLLTKPGLSLVDVAQEVRAGVRDLAISAEHEQTPAYYDQLTGKFYLAGEGQPGGGQAGSDELAQREEALRRRESELERRERERQGREQAQTASLTLPAKPQVENTTSSAVGVWQDVIAHKVEETFRDCPKCPEMTVVPAGEFMMGSPKDEPERYDDEGPQHKVTISKPFAVGRHSVTFAEWDACAADGGCGEDEPSDQGWGRGDRPVINVTWQDAQLYVKWLSRKTGKTYRLPSEAEREYFTRAGTSTPFWWGASVTPEQANYDGSVDPYKGGGRKGESRKTTLPVKAFAANPWGLYQVHGNIWEWTEDCYHPDYQGAPTDGSARTGAACANHTLRGGSRINGPKAVRSAIRMMWGAKGDFAGFRVVRAF
jgi:formylglycine-generating enzyme required for sulfatase activity